VANVKSAIKRVELARIRTLRNASAKSHMKTTIKKFLEAVNNGDQELAKVRLVKAISTLDKAAKKGIIHKNAAARKKSKLQKMYNTSAC